MGQPAVIHYQESWKGSQCHLLSNQRVQRGEKANDSYIVHSTWSPEDKGQVQMIHLENSKQITKEIQARERLGEGCGQDLSLHRSWDKSRLIGKIH